MKHCLSVLPATVLTVLTLCSCEISSESSDWGGGGAVYTDARILGTWNVTKYEAIDDHNQVFMTVTDESTIMSTFRCFTFDEYGNMGILKGKDQTGTTSYNYYAEYALLTFLTTATAETVTLTDTDYVFRSTWFAPVEWYKSDGSGQLLNEITTVQVTCTKVTATDE